MATNSTQSAAAISLAHVPAFRIGDLSVEPATRQVRRGAHSETLEPRVMQVLVALGRTAGTILTRDELIDRCWGGLVVGENAIQRAVSHVRDVAAGVGGGTFEVETITKVGYRIVVRDGRREAYPANGDSAAPPATLNRRLLIGSAVAAVAAGALGLGQSKFRDVGTSSTSTARTLYRKGLEAQRQGVAEQDRQATAYFREATAADPTFADAWGALALSYSQLLGRATDDQQEALARRSNSASDRALSLDPDNAEAQVGRILLRPNFRNWTLVESDARKALENGRDHWLLHIRLGRVLMDVGRWTDAVDHLQSLSARDAFLPLAAVELAGALGGAGRLEEAERLLVGALQRWPGHPELWFSRFHLLAYSGRPAAALDLANDLEGRPFGVAPNVFDSYLATARALVERTDAAVSAALNPRLDAVLRGSASAGTVAQLCAALGRKEQAFELLDAYYLGKGRWAGRPAPGPLSRRFTAFLFAAPMQPLHRHPNFSALTRNLGLADYWRSTGTRPDASIA